MVVLPAPFSQVSGHLLPFQAGETQSVTSGSGLKAIRLACTEPKPFIYSVHKRHIERVWPKL
jgi:hypothetical protein